MIKFLFPNKTEAVKLLKQEDAYLQKLNQHNFDLFNIRDKQEYLNKLSQCTLEFSKKQQERIKKIEKDFNQKIKELFPINNTNKPDLIVNMIKSNGSECGLAYTRQNFIVFTDRMYNFDAYIIHELFHVISRQNPFLTNLLYESLGFKKSNQDLLDLHDIKYILNPDAPINNYYLSKDDIKIIPYAENLSLRYKFLILDQKNHIADLPDSSKKYYKKYFIETFDPISYIIHPEEIVAEFWTAFWIKQINLSSSVPNHQTDTNHHLLQKIINILKDYEIRS